MRNQSQLSRTERQNHFVIQLYDDNFNFQGVRYTAVDGEVDQARISDILEQYFGARTS